MAARAIASSGFAVGLVAGMVGSSVALLACALTPLASLANGYLTARVHRGSPFVVGICGNAAACVAAVFANGCAVRVFPGSQQFVSTTDPALLVIAVAFLVATFVVPGLLGSLFASFQNDRDERPDIW